MVNQYIGRDQDRRQTWHASKIVFERISTHEPSIYVPLLGDEPRLPAFPLGWGTDRRLLTTCAQMDSAQVVSSRSFPTRSSSLEGETRPGGHESGKLRLRHASSMGNMDMRDVRGGGVGGGGRGSTNGGSVSGGGSGGNNNAAIRRRRHRRLVLDKSLRNTAHRPSPPTISEHQSMDHSHFDSNEKLSLSAGDATAETTVLSTETPTPETTPDSSNSKDSSVRVRRLGMTSSSQSNTNSSIVASERSVPLPQSIVTMTRTFPPPEMDSSTTASSIPRRMNKLKNTSTSRVVAAASDSLSSSGRLPTIRQRSQSLWGSETKEGTYRTPQQKSIRKVPTSAGAGPPALSPTFDGSKRFPKPRSSRPKPKLQRYSSAPAPTSSSPKKETTTVVDDVLMDRAFIIRQNLMNFEMQELALEAEKAAESGLKKFVGSTSKFGVEDTPPYRPKFVDDGEFVMASAIRSSEAGGGGFRTPLRSRKSFVNTLTHPMDYTPSYFSRKKIPVTSLRNFSEVVPNFSEMHINIRIHLSREGVDVNTLPELHSRRSLIKNDTDDTEKDEGDGDDAISQAPSVAASQAGSISSFSSYAVSSLHSLKEIIEFVHRPCVHRSRSPVDNISLRTSSSMSNTSRSNNSMPKDIEPSGSMRSLSNDLASSWSLTSHDRDVTADDHQNGVYNIPKGMDQHGSLLSKSHDSGEFGGDRKRGMLYAPNPIEHAGLMRSKPQQKGDFTPDRKKGVRTTLFPHTSTHFKPAVPFFDTDSDDSSVEFYGRKTPIEFSGQHSVSSHVSEVNQLTSALHSRSNISSPGDIRQPVLRQGRRKTTGASVSFETEKASYQALLDRMHHNSVSKSASYDVDQSSCAASLTNIDILPSSSPTDTNTSTPMANFLHKIQNQFSRTHSDIHYKTSKAADEDNTHFVSNFFYTNQDSGIVDPSGVAPTLKLDINPKRNGDPFCLTGCGPNDLISACETATKYGDLIFDYFNVKGSPKTKKNSAIIDPDAQAELPLNPKWIKTWQQANESENGCDRLRMFTPPKLSVRHAAQNDEDAFCSPESTKLGSECDDSMACPEVKEPLSCPEIQNNIGCSPE